ncbi:hypothetical protein PIB30_113864, partial [Stylosanthes scabra]|nr:hypothetical protein [Stylosanthes scabra]
MPCFDACAWGNSDACVGGERWEEACLPRICVLSYAYAWLWEGLARLGHVRVDFQDVTK